MSDVVSPAAPGAAAPRHWVLRNYVEAIGYACGQCGEPVEYDGDAFVHRDAALEPADDWPDELAALVRPCPACGVELRPDETHWSLFPEPMGGYLCPDLRAALSSSQPTPAEPEKEKE